MQSPAELFRRRMATWLSATNRPWPLSNVYSESRLPPFPNYNESLGLTESYEIKATRNVVEAIETLLHKHVIMVTAV